MKDNGTRAFFSDRQTSYIRAHNKTSEKKLFVVSIHNMRITVTVGVLCGKNIRRHSESSMRPILNSEKHFSHRIQYVDES